MTSATTRKRPGSDGPPPVRRAGFTLLELTLAAALIVLLVGTMVLSLSGWNESRRLEEGARRFEAMLCMARADAANLGRRLRLDFGENEDGLPEIQLLWESDPLGGAQQFTPYTACTWTHHVPSGLVEVARCESSGWDVTERDRSDETVLEPVTFYPDGSCDSAEIELISTSPADNRRALIEIDGLTGAVTRRILTSAELEEEVED